MTAPTRPNCRKQIRGACYCRHPKLPILVATVAVFAWGVAAICADCAAQATASAVTAPKADNHAKPDELGKDWVRIRYDDKHQVLAMESAIVRYEPAVRDPKASGPPVTVDLVGAVHIGDAAYYDGLNRRFEGYDALLYELVAPEGTVVERGRGTSNSHPIGALQNGMKAMLDLDHQLEKIDYTKKNFFHADMSPEQFTQAMKDRNEGFLQMYMRLLGQSLAQQSELAAQGESPDMAVFSALFADDRPLRLKRILAKQLADTESLLTSFGGEEGSVLISERNKIALKVLKEQLAAGKKRVAIFYGAGHLADMDQRLRKDFGMKPVSITWLTAWDLAPKH
jgi:hypothetical protein